jgi:large subunit ribosomal protein L4
MAEAAPSAPRLGGQGTVKLPAAIFGEPFHNAVVYESVRAEQLARRRGTAATKTRAQVRGGGAKPWRQKGTGRARAGSIRMPHWTGGGIAFGPSPRSYTVKVNRRARRRALRAALSVHARRGSIAVVDASSYSEPSTSTAAKALDTLEDARNVLVLLGQDELACAKSFRNIARAVVLPARETGVADVVGARHLVLSEAAVADLEAIAGEPQARTPQEEVAA